MDSEGSGHPPQRWDRTPAFYAACTVAIVCGGLLVLVGAGVIQ
jgi:hypothetical protein